MGFVERMKLTVPQDIFAREYVHLARFFVNGFGEQGERALREAIRLFGVTRGHRLREAHLNAGLKINLYNLFTYGDLPTDPRMRRNKIKLTPEERLSETLLCALFDQWRDMDAVALGRIYCEEFHHAKFGAYAPKSQTNLTQIMTQGDDYCRFSVYLRPGNMDDQEKALSFDECGEPEPKPVAYQSPSYQAGFTMLAVLLFQAVVLTTRGWFDDEGIAKLCRAAEGFACDAANFMITQADMVGVAYDLDFVRTHFPLPLPGEKAWDDWQEVLSAETGVIIERHVVNQLSCGFGGDDQKRS